MSQYIWVGLDVHIDSITAAILEHDSNDAEVLKMSGDLMKVRRLFRRLSEKAPVKACYEGSCAGYVLHRVLKRDGFHCDIIAPSLIPRNRSSSLPLSAHRTGKSKAVHHRRSSLSLVLLLPHHHSSQLVPERASFVAHSLSRAHVFIGVDVGFPGWLTYTSAAADACLRMRAAGAVAPAGCWMRKLCIVLSLCADRRQCGR
jgi:hypothetical protein